MGKKETIFKLNINSICPQQHYLCKEKLQRVEADFDQYDDLGRVYVIRYKGRYFSIDGHHRLYIANERGVDKVRVTMEYEDNDSKLYRSLADEAYDIGLRTIDDLKNRIINETEFEIKWIGKCQSMLKEMTD